MRESLVYRIDCELQESSAVFKFPIFLDSLEELHNFSTYFAGCCNKNNYSIKKYIGKNGEFNLVNSGVTVRHATDEEFEKISKLRIHKASFSIEVLILTDIGEFAMPFFFRQKADCSRTFDLLTRGLGDQIISIKCRRFVGRNNTWVTAMPDVPISYDIADLVRQLGHNRCLKVLSDAVIEQQSAASTSENV